MLKHNVWRDTHQNHYKGYFEKEDDSSVSSQGMERRQQTALSVMSQHLIFNKVVYTYGSLYIPDTVYLYGDYFNSNI